MFGFDDVFYFIRPAPSSGTDRVVGLKYKYRYMITYMRGAGAD